METDYFLKSINCTKLEFTMLNSISADLTSNVVIANENSVRKKTCRFCVSPIFCHYLALFILGLISWLWLWNVFGDGWRWDGQWFRIAAVGAVAWSAGEILQRLTALPPLMAAILTGILARYLDILDMRKYTEIDGFLRKIYPVIILGKSSLGWNIDYMKKNWKQVLTLGTLPWLAEVITLVACTHILIGFPIAWGFLLGSFYASVSCAVIMPSVIRLSSGCSRNWTQFICTAGGMDTALSVGVFGIFYSFIFNEAGEVYKYTKACSTLFAGAALGVTWGSVAGSVPNARDNYASELRVLFVLAGGLLANFLTSTAGWSGIGGVAVLACNATAAKHWSDSGWKLNNNPASTAYRVIWSTLEPLIFAYSGTFFEITSPSMPSSMLRGLAILVTCLTVRLAATALVCWNLSWREKLFVCCTWTPKSIVEAVLCPVALNAVLSRNLPHDPEKKYAEEIVRLIIQAILITTPLGFLTTKYLGPWLLKGRHKYSYDIDTPRKSVDKSKTDEVS